MSLNALISWKIAASICPYALLLGYTSEELLSMLSLFTVSPSVSILYRLHTLRAFSSHSDSSVAFFVVVLAAAAAAGDSDVLMCDNNSVVLLLKANERETLHAYHSADHK